MKKRAFIIFFIICFAVITGCEYSFQNMDKQSYRYIVKFDGAGAQTPADPDLVYVIYPDKTAGELPVNPVKTGFEFNNWWTEPEGAGTQFTGSTPVKSDMTVYAFWRIRVGYIDEKALTNAALPWSVVVNYDDIVTVADMRGGLKESAAGPIYEHEGEEVFIFAGWRDADNNRYSVGDETPRLTENLTLYAVWEELEVGDTGPAGGTIFYDKEEYSDGWRYLEAAPISDGTVSGHIWGDLDEIGTEAQGTAIGTGRENTDAIVSWHEDNLSDIDTAAGYCDQYSTQGYEDWFLPSIEELIEMLKELSPAEGNFWSSSESDVNNAFFWEAGSTETDFQSQTKLKSEELNVIPARRF